MNLKDQYELKELDYSEEEIERFDECKVHQFVKVPYVRDGEITYTVCCVRCMMPNGAIIALGYQPYYTNEEREAGV